MKYHIHRIIIYSLLGILFNQGSLIAEEQQDFAIFDLKIAQTEDLKQCATRRPKFSWQYSTQADNYKFEVALYKNDQSQVLAERISQTQAKSYQVKLEHRLQAGQNYYFIVRGQHPKQGWSKYDTLGFTINTPPTQPQFALDDNHIFVSDTLRFPMTAAQDQQLAQKKLKYHLQITNHAQQVALDTLVASPAIGAGSLTLKFQNNLVENSGFVARLRAYDGVAYSARQDSISFYINRRNDKPQEFRIKPINDTLNQSPVELEWHPATDPEAAIGGYIDHYWLEIAADSNFQKILYTKKIQSPDHKYSFSKVENHRFYFWRVQAIDNLGAQRCSNEFGYFVINRENQPPPAANLISPTSQEIIKPTDFIAWQQAEDPDQYDKLAFQVYITNFAVSDTLAHFYIDPATLEQAQADRLPWLSCNYQNILRLRLAQLLPSPTTLEEGSYYRIIIATHDNWQGKAVNNFAKTIFQYDDNINHQPEAPTIGIYPDSVVLQEFPIKMGWYPAADPDLNDALCYEILIWRATDRSGSNYMRIKTDYGQNQISVRRNFVENCKYLWKVRSYDMQQARSDWSDTYCFFINNVNEAPQEPVKIVQPQNWAELNPSTRFQWRLVEDPDPGDTLDYIIEFAKDKYFRNIKHSRQLAAESLNTDPQTGLASFTFDSSQAWQNLQENEIYFWRIAALDPAGLRSPYLRSYPRITLNKHNDPPAAVQQIKAPKSGQRVNTQRPTIQWAAAKDPDFMDFARTLSYTIQFSKSIDFATYNVYSFSTQVGETAFTIPQKLPENMQWYYRIQTIDHKGSTSNWSRVDSFVVNAKQEAPKQVARGFVLNNNAISETRQPKLSWRPVSDPDIHHTQALLVYQIDYLAAQYLGTSKAPRKTHRYTTQPGRTAMLLPQLKENQQYAYRVRALDPDGIPSDWSSWQFFWVNAEQQAPLPFEIIRPYNGQDSVMTDITFQWLATQDPDPYSQIEYTITISTDSLFQQNVMRSHIVPQAQDTISYNPPAALLAATKYFWQVTAEDNTCHRLKMPAAKDQAYIFTTVGYRRLNDSQSQSMLLQNSPNPFNRSTKIQYYINDYASVKIIIYNVLGEKVKVLFNGKKSQGRYQVSWDGTNQDGRPVPGGMYFCRLFTRENKDLIKMVLLR